MTCFSPIEWAPAGPRQILWAAGASRGDMKTTRAVLSLLALLVAACGGASSQAESKQPAPLPPAPVKEPGNGTAYDDATGEPVAARTPGYPDSPPPYAPYYGERPPAYSPYGVEILSGDYRHLPTYYSSGRAYVMGTIGERY